MSWIVANIHRLMIVSGVLTLTMVYAAIAPDTALQSTFGESVSGPVADVVVRNWGALIALMGAMLIYGARRPAVRPLVLTVAGASKVAFVALVLSHGGRFLGHAGIAVVVDLVWILLFAAYLFAVRRLAAGRPEGQLDDRHRVKERALEQRTHDQTVSARAISTKPSNDLLGPRAWTLLVKGCDFAT